MRVLPATLTVTTSGRHLLVVHTLFIFIYVHMYHYYHMLIYIILYSTDSGGDGHNLFGVGGILRNYFCG